MTELKRLLETSSDEAELAILRSLDGEEPSGAVLARTATALGLGAGALTAAGGASAASGLAAKSSLWGPVLKALAIGVGSGVIVSAAVPAVISEPAREPVAPAMVENAPVAVPQAAARAPKPVVRESSRPEEPSPPRAGFSAPSVGARAIEPIRAPEQATQAEVPSSRAAFAPASALVTAPVAAVAQPPAMPQSMPAPSEAKPIAKSAPAAVSIAEEVKAVDRARRALSSGNAREALRELERYQVAWPRGVFTSEVLVLRVEAKLKLGDRGGAVREANALIESQPNSRYAARLRALIGNSK